MVVIDLIMTEKLSVEPLFSLQALTAWGEEGETTTVRWWKMGPQVSFWEVDGLEMRLDTL